PPTARCSGSGSRSTSRPARGAARCVAPLAMVRPMAEGLLLVAESTANGDMYAASRFLTGDPVLWLEADGRTALVVTGFDLELASRQSRADEVWAVEELTAAE